MVGYYRIGVVGCCVLIRQQSTYCLFVVFMLLSYALGVMIWISTRLDCHGLLVTIFT